MITTNFSDLLEVVEREETDGTFPPTKKRNGLRLQNLQKIRGSLGLSTKDVTHFLDVSDYALRDYESNRSAPKSIQRVKKIAQVLGCSVEDLTTYEDLQRYHSKDNVKDFGGKRYIQPRKNIQANSDKSNEQRIADLSNTLDEIITRLDKVEGEKKSIWQRLFS